MSPRPASSISQRVEVVRLKVDEQVSHRSAARTLGYSRAWSRTWVRRFRRGGLPALQPPPVRSPHPLASFAPRVAEVARAYRQSHPLIGARRALLALADDPRLRGERLPSARTLHRFFAAEGLVKRRLPPDREPSVRSVAAGAAHDVWEIDHQDHLAINGLDCRGVVQNIRDPAAGLSIGSDLFVGPRGAQGVATDALFDALRRRLTTWGRPRAFQVDHAALFLGRPQRQFPRRFELLARGWGIRVQPIRAGRPTDNGAGERFHRTVDGILLGPIYPSWEAAQAALDQQQEDLNTRFPSRARGCQGCPPLVAAPQARHSGRPYDPAREWAEFDQAAVDRFLAGWEWHRQVGKRSPAISFGHINITVPQAHRGSVVLLAYDPSDRQVVIYQMGETPATRGPEIRRFRCAAFTREVILGTSTIAWRPPSHDRLRPNDTPQVQGEVQPRGT